MRRRISNNSTVGERGFTLIELLIVVVLITIILTLVEGAFRTSLRVMETANSRGQAISSLNQVLWVMSSELETAAREVGDAVDSVAAISVTDDGAPVAAGVSGNQVNFQFPTGLDTWTQPLQYRFINEDANDNAILDAGEDTNGDGRLTRRIERVNLTSGIVEPVGGSNDIADVQFRLDEDNEVLTIFILSTREVAGTRTNANGPLQAQVTSGNIERNVYLFNTIEDSEANQIVIN